MSCSIMELGKSFPSLRVSSMGPVMFPESEEYNRRAQIKGARKRLNKQKLDCIISVYFCQVG